MIRPEISVDIDLLFAFDKDEEEITIVKAPDNLLLDVCRSVPRPTSPPPAK